jgi:hypothetical protein
VELTDLSEPGPCLRERRHLLEARVVHRPGSPPRG